MSAEWLNLNQTPEELRELYRQDKYWYLRSSEFKAAFLNPIGDHLWVLGCNSVLDVGCGEGQLGDSVSCTYLGFDGHLTVRDETGFACKRVKAGRIEDPNPRWGRFDAVVFGGIMEVLVKPQHRVDLMELYRRRFDPLWFVVYDLERLDTSLIKAKYGPPVWEHRARADMDPARIDHEVKLERKVLIYRAKDWRGE